MKGLHGRAGTQMQVVASWYQGWGPEARQRFCSTLVQVASGLSLAGRLQGRIEGGKVKLQHPIPDLVVIDAHTPFPDEIILVFASFCAGVCSPVQASVATAPGMQ